MDHGRHHHHHHNPFSSSVPIEHVSHLSSDVGALSREHTVRIFSKAEENYCLSVRDGQVVLAPANPRDVYQHWIKDLKFSTRVKDEEGFPGFALVNKGTGQAIKHSIGGTHPVRLVPYNPDYLDESVLWTESRDTGEGFRCIRMVNNIRLNLDALHGDEQHGGVHDGTNVVLWEWLKGKNQRWKIVPWEVSPPPAQQVYPPAQHVYPPLAQQVYPPPAQQVYPPTAQQVYHPAQHMTPGWEGGALTRQPTVRIFTKAGENFSLSIRDGNAVLMHANPRDEYQHWFKDMKYSTTVKDEEGFPSFALVNKVTGQAIKHSVGATNPVRLIPYNPDYLDESVLWSESRDTGEGFRCIRMVNNIRLNFDAFHGDESHGGVRDGTTIVLWEWLKGKNQRWKIAPY